MSVPNPDPGPSRDVPGEVGVSALAARRRFAVLGFLLFIAPLIAGSQWIGAPFLQGDEQIFIAGNPDVTGQGRTQPLMQRLVGIFMRVHQDLYQPLPILSYAIEWAMTRDPAAAIRRTDLVLHAVNGLLLWWVLVDMLRRIRGSPRDPEPDRDAALVSLAWLLALLWSLHPINVGVYAADMGRTHLLAALFTLPALWLYPRANLGSRRGAACLAGLVACLVSAMLSKAIPGLLLVAVGLELCAGGVRGALRSPRLYATAAICAFFAWLTLRTSERWGMMADADIRLFGDPLSRSLLAVWIYARSVVSPVSLAPWYPPDPDTSYANPRCWGGALIALATVVVALWAARDRRRRPITVGVLWVWGLLLPVIGLVGARTFAAQDRYLYQPLMGVMLAVGARIADALSRLEPRAARRWRRVANIAVAALAVGFALIDLPLAASSRSMIQRATLTAALDPDDPRAALFLAASYEFSAQRDAPERRFAAPAGAPDFAQAARTALRRAADLSRRGARYFATPADRASFHLRTSLMMQKSGDAAGALEQALAAQAAEPDTVLGLLRLAQALWANGRRDDARRAYERLAATVPRDAPNRAACLTEFGSLLLNMLQQPDAARHVFADSLAPLLPETPPEDPSAFARALTQKLDQVAGSDDPFGRRFGADTAHFLAAVGLARSEIRAGLGEVGFQLARALRRLAPGNPDTTLVEAEYHLRSHHWTEARDAYTAILEQDPTRYDALIGLHETSVQTGAWADAANAWRRGAAAAGPDSPLQRPFSSFFVWSVACGGHPRAADFADELLAADADNPLGCLAHAVLACRGGRVDVAQSWVVRATRGEELSQTRAFERAAATLAVLRARGDLPAEAAIIEAQVRMWVGQPDLAGDALRDYLREHPVSEWRARAESLLNATSQPASAEAP